MSDTSYPYIIRLAAALVSITLIVFALYHLKVVLVPLLFATIFSVMLFPFCVRLEKWGLPKALASLLTVFVTTVILGFLAYLLVMQISVFTEQIPQLSHKFNLIINDIRDYAAQKFNMKKSVVATKIQEQLTILQNSSNIFSVNSLITVSSIIVDVFLVPLYIFFLLYYRHFFVEFFYKIFTDTENELIDETVAKIGLVIKGYLSGQFIDTLIIGTVNSLALYFIGVGYAIVLGFIIAILCIIPYLGMIIGSLLALLVAMLTTNTGWQPLTAFGVLWVIHLFDSNLLSPIIIGSRVSINPLVAVVMLFLFGALWGLPGLFLALPLTAILKVIFDAIPGLKHFGFLLGTPEKYHLKKNSLLHIQILARLVERKKQKPIIESLPDELAVEKTGDEPEQA